MDDFIIALQASIDKAKSAENINKNDIPKLQKKLDTLKLQAKIDEKSLKKIALQLEKITGQKNTVSNIGIDTKQAGKDGKKYGEAFSKGASGSINSGLKVGDVKMIKTASAAQEEPAASGGFKRSENSMQATGRLAAFFKEQLSKAAESFTKWFSVGSGVMFLVSKTKESISELKEINTLLTEISKENHKLSKSDLSKIRNDSFEIASKYGKTAPDYLAGVQEASRAGYENAMGIAELSVAAQCAGDMTAELANQYIIATDKAYNLGGSVEKLTEVLDGSNYITSHNAVNMTELAEGMSIAGSQAASLGVNVDEATAVLGTMIAATQQSGSEMARAFKAILLNIQQVTDEEEGVDAEGLTKYEEACKALNVSLKETKNGITSLRNPMEVLKDLADEYSKLDSGDIRRTNLLSSVGGKPRAAALNAILENYDMYSKMLDEYAQGTGSMAAEAEKTANSWEGSMNRLSNTWTDAIKNIANSDTIIAVINSLNGLVGIINGITEKLGSFRSIGLGIGLFAGVKNIGKTYEYTDFINCCLF